MPELIRRATAACEALIPGIRAVPFGHMGDGNIHFNLEQPVDWDAARFLAQDHAIMDTVNDGGARPRRQLLGRARRRHA